MPPTAITASGTTRRASTVVTPRSVRIRTVAPPTWVLTPTWVLDLRAGTPRPGVPRHNARPRRLERRGRAAFGGVDVRAVPSVRPLVRASRRASPGTSVRTPGRPPAAGEPRPHGPSSVVREWSDGLSPCFCQRPVNGLGRMSCERLPPPRDSRSPLGHEALHAPLDRSLRSRRHPVLGSQSSPFPRAGALHASSPGSRDHSPARAGGVDGELVDAFTARREPGHDMLVPVGRQKHDGRAPECVEVVRFDDPRGTVLWILDQLDVTTAEGRRLIKAMSNGGAPPRDRPAAA